MRRWLLGGRPPRSFPPRPRQQQVRAVVPSCNTYRCYSPPKRPRRPVNLPNPEEVRSGKERTSENTRNASMHTHTPAHTHRTHVPACSHRLPFVHTVFASSPLGHTAFIFVHTVLASSPLVHTAFIFVHPVFASSKSNMLVHRRRSVARTGPGRHRLQAPRRAQRLLQLQ